MAESEDLLMVATKRNGERYIWIYSPSHATDVLRSAGRFAINQDLNFTWWDAALVSQAVRRAVADESLGVEADVDDATNFPGIGKRRKPK